jgi:hypothetical protein
MDSVTPDDVDPHREIAQLEDRIEQLAHKLEGCRKVALAARIALVSGGVILLALMFGLIRFDPLAMTVAIAALLGGTVLAGSNRSTALEAEAELAASERRRAELIGTIPLRVAEERPTLH